MSSSSSLLSQQAYDALYQSLITKRLQPGDEINRRQMAAELGVGIGPVVEAMLQLEWEGFLEARPRKGTKVKLVTARHMLGWVHLRVAIEAQAARIYAGPQIKAASDRLLAMAGALDATPRDTDQSVYHEVAFHRALVNVADNPVISGMFDHVMRHSFYYSATRLLPKCPDRHAQMHVKLVKALAVATPEEADTLVRGHLGQWIQLLTQAADNEAAASPPAGGRGRPTPAAGKKPAKKRQRA